MTKYLVDTTVLVDCLRNREMALEFVVKNGSLKVSFATCAELIQGVKNKSEQAKVQKLMNLFTIDWGSEAIGQSTLRIMDEFQLKQKLGFIDALIASTAITSDLVLVTDNVKHFRGIEGLVVKKLTEVVK